MTLKRMTIATALVLTCSLPLAAQAVKPLEKTITESSKPAGLTYRLTYTVTESEGTKRVGVQHFALTLMSAEHGLYANMKLGSKVPVETGSYNPGSSQAQTQFSYIDVGLSINASLNERANGLVVETKVEQSSVAELNAQTKQPLIRQAVLQNMALLTPGKPVVLGSLDTPGSTHHLDIEVVLELVR